MALLVACPCFLEDHVLNYYSKYLGSDLQVDVLKMFFSLSDGPVLLEIPLVRRFVRPALLKRIANFL